MPDFPVDKAPGYKGPADARGMDAIAGDDPFIMLADGRAWLFAPAGLLDGPLPTHYEPLESPVQNALYPNMHANPGGAALAPRRQPLRQARRPGYPCVATTFRLTEHHTAGGDVALAAVARRAPAGDVRRDRPGARAADAGSRTAAG